jgi:hypothetical protein
MVVRSVVGENVTGVGELVAVVVVVRMVIGEKVMRGVELVVVNVDVYGVLSVTLLVSDTPPIVDVTVESEDVVDRVKKKSSSLNVPVIVPVCVRIVPVSPGNPVPVGIPVVVAVAVMVLLRVEAIFVVVAGVPVAEFPVGEAGLVVEVPVPDPDPNTVVVWAAPLVVNPGPGAATIASWPYSTSDPGFGNTTSCPSSVVQPLFTLHTNMSG